MQEKRQEAWRVAPERNPGESPFHTFCQTNRRQVARALAALPDHSCRSIRRGALVHYARAGATDAELQLLSGHRRRNTLPRYLGWGHESSEASAAATSRPDKATGSPGGACPPP